VLLQAFNEEGLETKKCATRETKRGEGKKGLIRKTFKETLTFRIAGRGSRKEKSMQEIENQYENGGVRRLKSGWGGKRPRI